MSPNQTCAGLCAFNFNLEDNTSPAAIITDTRYHIRGEYIFMERMITMAASAPAPTE